MDLIKRLKAAIRHIPDFPKHGILFKDITPVFKDPQLCIDVAEEMARQLKPLKPDAIVGIESRGSYLVFF